MGFFVFDSSEKMTAAAASSSYLLPIPIFNGENYEFWKIKMRTLLRSQNLWRYVEVGHNEPNNEESLSVEEKKKLEEEEGMDARALLFLQQGVTDALFPRISTANRAKEAWDILEHEFQGEIKVKAKTINEILSEAEKNLGRRPGATASIRIPHGVLPGAQGNMSPGGYPVNRPGTGGMMPGMPGTRKMPGMPGIDNDNWEVQRSRSMLKGDMSGARFQSPLIGKPTPLNSKLLPQGSAGFVSGKTSASLQGNSTVSCTPNFGSRMEPVGQVPLWDRASPSPTPPVVVPLQETSVPNTTKMNPDELHRKTIALLDEYFGIRLLDEALLCVVELQAPFYHQEIVKEAISIGLEKNPTFVDLVAKLLEYLFAKKVFTAEDIGTGCLLYASMLDDIVIDLPRAPNYFGEIIGKLILTGNVNFNLVKEVLKKVEDDIFRKTIFDAATRVVTSSPAGQGLLEAQASDFDGCKNLP